MEHSNPSYFARVAATYADRADQGGWGLVKRLELRQVMAEARALSPRLVLDLGCGPGIYTRAIADQLGAEVWAVDREPTMVAQIQHPKTKALAGDATSIALPGNFDLVLLLGVLEFSSDPARLLRVALNSLKPQGRLLVLSNSDSPFFPLYRRYHIRRRNPLRRYDRRALTEASAKYGWQIEDTKMLPFAHLYRLGRLR